MFLESKIAVIPAGVWGATWSLVAAQQGHNIKLYIRNPEDCRILNEDRIYKKVPGMIFPEKVTAVDNAQEALKDAEVVVLAPNSLGYRDFVRNLNLRHDQKILNLTKGLEVDTGLRMSEVFEQEHPGSLSRLAVWSGPNVANRIAFGEKAEAHIASHNPDVALFYEKTFGRGNIKLYPTYDVTGVELGGALKNIITMGKGLISGLGLDEVLGEEIFKQGFTEMVILGLAYGACEPTFNGPSGIGDLMASINFQSRNFLAGCKLAKGETYSDLVASGITYEGIHTVKPALYLAKQAGIKTPVMSMVYSAVFPRG